MSTPYERVYESFLSKFRSYEFCNMSEEQVLDYMHDYLSSAISRFYACEKDLCNRDDILMRFNEDLSNVEIDILSSYMLLEYIDATYVRTPTLLKANLSSTDFNAFSSANLLSKITESQRLLLSETEAKISRYSWLAQNSNSGKKLKDIAKRTIRNRM